MYIRVPTEIAMYFDKMLGVLWYIGVKTDAKTLLLKSRNLEFTPLQYY